MRIHDPRRSSSKLFKDIAFIFAAVAVLAFGFPFVVPYLPYGMQDSVAQLQASVFGTAPAGDSGTPGAKPASANAVAAVTGTPAVVARAVIVRATAGAGAAVVTRLKKGDAVIVIETQRQLDPHQNVQHRWLGLDVVPEEIAASAVMVRGEWFSRSLFRYIHQLGVIERLAAARRDDDVMHR